MCQKLATTLVPSQMLGGAVDLSVSCRHLIRCSSLSSQLAPWVGTVMPKPDRSGSRRSGVLADLITAHARLVDRPIEGIFVDA
jgi:hypothetical protein